MKDDENDGFLSEAEKRKINRTAIISVILAAIVVLTFFLGYYVRGMTESELGQKINEMMGIIGDTSIYNGNDSADDFAKRLVEIIKADDKYAAYYSPEEYKKLLSEDRGNYSGVGVGFLEDCTVGKVYLNSPAYKAGVKVGDTIVSGVYNNVGEKVYVYFTNKLEQENEGKEE